MAELVVIQQTNKLPTLMKQVPYFQHILPSLVWLDGTEEGLLDHHVINFFQLEKIAKDDMLFGKVRNPAQEVFNGRGREINDVYVAEPLLVQVFCFPCISATGDQDLLILVVELVEVFLKRLGCGTDVPTCFSGLPALLPIGFIKL